MLIDGGRVMRRSLSALVVAGAVVACSGGGAIPLAPLPACHQGATCIDPFPQGGSVDKVDLLLVIDNGSSMGEEQLSVVTGLPRMIQHLTTGDRDGDGTIDFMPARSIHVGIVDTDMGLGDVTGIASCDPGFGDDGLMQIRARRPATGCMADYSRAYPGNVFAFDVAGAHTPAQFEADLACVAALGTDGCGFPFVLDAPLKAISLTPTGSGDSPVSWTRRGYLPPVFYAGTFGHGDDPATNGAFLRPDSALAIVTVNDHDDCSTSNPNIFSIDDPAFNGVDLALRCHAFDAELYPIERYADGFTGLRANPALLVFAAITGVPPALSGRDPATILADPAMVSQIDPTHAGQLEPVCIEPSGRGIALPAIRVTRLAQQLRSAGAKVTLESICNADFTSAFDHILTLIVDTLGPSVPCIRPLMPSADGTVDCQLYASGTHCTDFTPAVAVTESTDQYGYQVCRLPQITRDRAGIDPGWIYDDGTLGAFSMLPHGCTQRIAFSALTAHPAPFTLVCP